MQMIDVLKRLAQLDAKNTNVVKESTKVQECGPMMGMMDSMSDLTPEKPSVPANFSINATASNGAEVADMMSQILTLAGMKQVGDTDMGVEPPAAVVTTEPAMGVGPTAADSMRSVLDKLNPEPEDSGEEELGPFQHDSEGPGEEDSEEGDEEDSEEDSEEGDEEEETDEGLMGAALGGVAGGALTKTPAGAMTGAEIGSDIQDALSGDKEETEEGAYDNSPADPTKAPAADADEYAHHENQPGSGETRNGEKRQSNLPTATFEALMKEYKQFIGEGDEEKPGKEEDEDMEEGIEDRLKDLDPKNPVNIPAYQRKAKSGDSAAAAKNTRESVETADILKLAGLK